MPKTIERTIYTFNELSDSAKERAREWYREGSLDYDWWDSVYEDAVECAAILGIDLKQKPVKLMNGATRYDPAIYFSGFWSQGDGARWEGTYAYAKNAPHEIKKFTCGSDVELLRIATELQALQRRHFYGLSARVGHRGYYEHSHTMDIEVFARDGNYADKDTHEELAQLLRDFADWIYRRLEEEYEYLNSDETVDANMVANEYTFDEHGRREG